MEITLHGQKVQLYFGIRFIREMDNRYFTGNEVAKYGVGLENAYDKLKNHDLVMLDDVLASATATQFIFTDKDFDEFYSETDPKEIDKICDELAKNLLTQPMTKKRVTTFKKNLDEVGKKTAQE